MGCLYFILAGVMALFGVLGYLYGTGAALLTLAIVVIGLLVTKFAGPTIVNIINKFYQLFMSGGVQAFLGSGDLAQVKANMAKIPPLIPSDAAAAFMLLVLIVLILLGILLGMHPRFRRPPSLVALLIGLVSGYLVGGYLLVIMFPSLAGVIPLPFGLVPQPALPTAPLGSTDLWAQFVTTINNASERSLALIVAFVVAAVILIALIATLRRRPGRTGGGGAGGRG
jgi:hypothetical protein